MPQQTASVGSRVARYLTLAILVITGALGLRNGLAEWPEAQGVLQKSVTAGVFLYGVFGALSAVAVWRGSRWSLWLTATWGLVITYVGSTAALAYGGADATPSAAVAGGVVTALIAVAVCWSVRALIARE